MKKNDKSLIIALGGNALNNPENQEGFEEQVKNAKKTAQLITKIAKSHKLVITHGNGPQVGNILLQQEYSKTEIPLLPLSLCGAQSQGQIGAILINSLNNEFEKQSLGAKAVTVITHVLVNPQDPAFKDPQKPIGPIYTPKEAKDLKKQGMTLRKIMVGAYRRVVPSPLPLEILELEVIKKIWNKKLVPITCGGGGIPVIKNQKKLKLVDAVIDKDLASQVLANQLKAETLIILTNIKGVALNFQKPNQKWLRRLNLKEAKYYLDQGQFLPGSMEPKIRASIRFIENGGKKVIIAHLKDLIPALEEKKGTTISCH